MQYDYSNIYAGTPPASCKLDNPAFVMICHDHQEKYALLAIQSHFRFHENDHRGIPDEMLMLRRNADATA